MKLKDIKDPLALQKLSNTEAEKLIADARKLIIDKTMEHGGHIGANLAVVEIAMGILRVFNPHVDKVLWDIGHNCYPWKIFTGRAAQMDQLRDFKGLKGFQCMKESKFDHVEAGNSSTSPSIALGYAAFAKPEQHFISVIGDQSIMNGTSMEFFNHAHDIKNPVIIIINDNEAAIGPTVGLFGAKKDGKLTYPDAFEKLAHLFKFQYIGPVNGHDLKSIEKALREASALKQHVVVHIKTKKGQGLLQAKNDDGRKWHQVSRPIINQKWHTITTPLIISHMEKDPNICLITAAMRYPANLNDIFTKFPDRCFDVGIAEGHAVSFAGGLALAGKRPYVLMHSPFLRRTYDHIIHDVMLMRLPVVFGIEDADISENGSTHHGFYDIKMFEGLHHAIMLAPSNWEEASIAFDIAFTQTNNCVGIRYQKHLRPYQLSQHINQIVDLTKGPKWICYDRNADVCIISHGSTFAKIRDIIETYDLSVSYVNAFWLIPLDVTMLTRIMKKYKRVIVADENIDGNGLDGLIAKHVDSTRIEKWNLPFSDIPFGQPKLVKKSLGIDWDGFKVKLFRAAGKTLIKDKEGTMD